MSESSSEDFSDSESDVSQEQQAIKKVENGKRKVIQEPNSKVKDSPETDSSDADGDASDTAPQPVKKRKTLQDYLNEKVRHGNIELLSITSIAIDIF